MNDEVIMPTQDEIVDRYRERSEEDTFGFEAPIYGNYLDWEHGREFARDTITEAEWTAQAETLDRDKLLAEIRDYLPFAWDKANNQRGVSASRSIMHFTAWTWLAGDRAFSEKIEANIDTMYNPYGKPLLRMISERYGVDWKALDSELRPHDPDEIDERAT